MFIEVCDKLLDDHAKPRDIAVGDPLQNGKGPRGTNGVAHGTSAGYRAMQLPRIE